MLHSCEVKVAITRSNILEYLFKTSQLKYAMFIVLKYIIAIKWKNNFSLWNILFSVAEILFIHLRPMKF